MPEGRTDTWSSFSGIADPEFSGIADPEFSGIADPDEDEQGRPAPGMWEREGIRMGGGHVERGERPERWRWRGRSRSRHREESASGESTGGAGRESGRRGAEATGPFSFSTTALVIAVTGQVGLGLVARSVSDAGQTGSARPAATTFLATQRAA